MAVLGELLFYHRNGVALDDVLRHKSEQGVRDAVDRLPDTAFNTQTDDALTQTVVQELNIVPLNISLDQAKANVKEITLDVQDAFGDRVRIKGLRATKTIPFSGNPELWSYRPNPYDMNPPYGQIQGQSLVIGLDVREHETEQAATHIEQAIQTVATYLKGQETQVASFNNSLPSKVLPQVQMRRARLASAANLLKKLQS